MRKNGRLHCGSVQSFVTGEGEVEQDIEVLNAITPKANVLVYEGPNSDQGVIDTYQKIASDDKAKQSVSVGDCLSCKAVHLR